MSPCHCGSTRPGSTSPGLHDMGQRLRVTRALCHRVTWVPHHLGSMSLCVTWQLHVTWTLCHCVTQQLRVSVSPGLHINWTPHHPVSPGSSMSLCHLGSSMPGSTSPGLHDMGHRLCVTRAPCLCVTRVPLGSTSPGLHVTLCHLAAPYQHVTWVPQHLAPCHQGSMSLCHPGSTGLHITWQLCVPVSPGFHSAPCHPAAPCHCVTWAPQCLVPHHQGSVSLCHLRSMSPGLYIIVSPSSSMSLRHQGSVSLCHPGSTGLHIT